MGKIQDFIIEHKVTPKQCVYHTWREVKSKDGKKTGKMRVLVPPQSETAMVEYTCPECQHTGYTEQPWKRPFGVKCEKCNARLTVPKLRDQAKREAKKGN